MISAPAAWQAWHQDPAFAETRKHLDGLEAGPSEHWWHEVVQDVRPGSATSGVGRASR